MRRQSQLRFEDRLVVLTPDGNHNGPMIAVRHHVARDIGNCPHGLMQEGGKIQDLVGMASAFIPVYAPEEVFEIATRLYKASR